MDRETEAWVAQERPSPALVDDLELSYRDALRWMRRSTILEAALRRTGHTAARADHHAQVCALCTALRQAEAVDGTTRDHPAGDDSREADLQQRQRPA